MNADFRKIYLPLIFTDNTDQKTFLPRMNTDFTGHSFHGSTHCLENPFLKSIPLAVLTSATLRTVADKSVTSVLIRGEVFVLAKGQELRAKSHLLIANCYLLIANSSCFKIPTMAELKTIRLTEQVKAAG
jgi:hypothetical protein